MLMRIGKANLLRPHSAQPTLILNTNLKLIPTFTRSIHTSSSHTMSDQPNSYASALERLAQLQSNKAVTSLFGRPASTSSPPVDLNSLAIPEMLDWLRRAGYTPEDLATSGLRCVHVAGTKGKGSVSTFIASILHHHLSSTSASSEAAPSRRRRVGLYTSPHVLSVRERIVVDGLPLPRDKFARYVHEVWARLTDAARQEAARQNLTNVSDAELDGPATKPFYFRFLTLVAAHAFAREGVTDAVVECGIGGEYDATSAWLFAPELVTAGVVTQLGIDHVAMLGGTVEEIAWHKAGVWKAGRKGLTVRQPTEEATEVLRQRGREKGVEEIVVVEDEVVERWEGVEGARLQGPFQKKNMALAVAAAREHLLRTGVVLEGRFGTNEWTLADLPETFLRGLREASLPGRSQVVVDERGIEWHIDGAHTDDSLRGVGQWFASQAGSGDEAVRVLVFNQQDRKPGPLLEALVGSGLTFHHAVFTRNDETSAGGDLGVQEALAEKMRELNPEAATAVYDAVQLAVDHVRHVAEQAEKDNKPCEVLVTGSFHLAGPVLKALGQSDEP
ncbi:hypothetical protein VTJ04DRAFT_1863 [Mycothermus thermophilus]|uniref:uncharacterized protein n=1 Tax=Humicola insolens TaxID=85995 RepID=UPI003741F2CC